VRLQKTVVTDKPLGKVFGYLSDFTTTIDWDPGTVATVRQKGDGGIGTIYLNTSEFLGRKTELSYVVQEFVPGERIRLRGENKTVISVDTMTFLAAGDGTEVTYTAEFAFKGAARYVAPLFRPALARLGNQAEAGLRRALSRL
jgi:Polyketide cyclase / dehydrase and lipid transport